jgi:uncharacterized protein
VYLVDTNIWLEHLLKQARSEDVGAFFAETPAKDIWLTDFSFHSIAILLTRHGLFSSLTVFTKEVVIDGGVVLVRLLPEDMERVIARMQDFGLDFDDAYQYVAAEIHDLRLISFDKHFDSTPNGRLRLEDLLGRHRSSV